MKILVLPGKRRGYDVTTDRTWNDLPSFAETSVLPFVDGTRLMMGDEGGVHLDRCCEIARGAMNGQEVVLGNYVGGFLWRCIFRLAGVDVPFCIVPRYNCVRPLDSYAAILASQFQVPGDFLMAGCAAAGRSFKTFGFETVPFHPTAIDDGFQPSGENRATLRRMLGLPETGDILLFTGRAQDDKHVLELLDVFAAVRSRRPASLIICYHFDTADYLERCRARGSTIGDVHFIPNPSQPDLVHYYCAADLFVSTGVSVYETFGLSIVEAMACGTPPIVSQYNGFNDTVAPGCGILVPTREIAGKKLPDVAKFTEAVLRALQDQPLRAEMAKRSIARSAEFRRKPSLQRTVAQIEKRCVNVAAARPLPTKFTTKQLSTQAAALFAPLEGCALVDLVSDVLSTGKPPMNVPPAVQEEFSRHWFEHY